MTEPSNLLKSGHAHIEATKKAADEWSVEMDRAAQSSLLPLAPSSWYMGGNIPGKPRVVLPYAGGMPRYAQIAKQVADENYRGFLIS